MFRVTVARHPAFANWQRRAAQATTLSLRDASDSESSSTRHLVRCCVDFERSGCLHRSSSHEVCPMSDELIDDDEVRQFIQALHGDARDRVLTLQSLSHTPRPDERLLAACESLLEDRTIALMSIPYSFGEFRWCAADAVAALRGALGILDPVAVSDVFAPVSMDKALRMVRLAGIAKIGGIEALFRHLKYSPDWDCCHVERSPERQSA